MPEYKFETKTSEAAKEEVQTEVESQASVRDDGVSEAVWQELIQAQKREQEEQERIKWEQQEALRLVWLLLKFRWQILCSLASKWTIFLMTRCIKYISKCFIYKLL